MYVDFTTAFSEQLDRAGNYSCSVYMEVDVDQLTDLASNCTAISKRRIKIKLKYHADNKAIEQNYAI